MSRDAQGPRMARRCQQGATLLEALLAATLLALATLAALQLGSEAAMGSRAALQRARAIELAAELAERLQADPQTDISSWQRDAVALLAPTGSPAASEAASVLYLPATSAAPSQWRIQLRWIDAADGQLASHSALVQRQGLGS